MGNTKEFSQLTKQLREAIINDGKGKHYRIYARFLDALEQQIKRYKGLEESQYSDILTETCIVLKKKIVLGAYNEQGNFMSYCGKIAHYMRKREEAKVMAYQKKYADLDKNMIEDYTEDELELRSEYPSKSEKLQKALIKLSKPEIAILYAFYVHGETSGELAKTELTTAGNIRQRIHKIKQKLIKFSKNS